MKTVAFVVRGVLWIVAGFALLFAVLLAQDARAEPVCLAVDRLLEALNASHGEEPVGQGETATGATLLIMVHPEGSTWSLVAVLPDGRACLLGYGTDWRSLATKPGSEI
ncbi:hypothetical protein [Tabrizicola flagellatus]|uniref:hypothetical protein n=1 Tax=Tabrizicola flagellatus TaxID=2593021 RepID=UPI0011F11BDE|nr:hypothetical protein [Tabrizicola flagellatus]